MGVLRRGRSRPVFNAVLGQVVLLRTPVRLILSRGGHRPRAAHTLFESRSQPIDLGIDSKILGWPILVAIGVFLLYVRKVPRAEKLRCVPELPALPLASHLRSTTYAEHICNEHRKQENDLF